MKKVIGLCLVVLLSSTSVFARENRRMDKRKMDPSARCEKMIADLKLDEKQAADFRKVEAEFRDKMKAERKQADWDRRKMREKMMSLRDDRDAEMKKILTEDQYKQINSSTGLAVNYYKLLEELGAITDLVFENKIAKPLKKGGRFANLDVSYNRDGILYFTRWRN